MHGKSQQQCTAPFNTLGELANAAINIRNIHDTKSLSSLRLIVCSYHSRAPGDISKPTFGAVGLHAKVDTPMAARNTN